MITILNVLTNVSMKRGKAEIVLLSVIYKTGKNVLKNYSADVNKC
jgi:hypothetical protein